MKRFCGVMLVGVSTLCATSLLTFGCRSSDDSSSVRADDPAAPSVTIVLSANGLAGTVANMADTKFEKIQTVSLAKPAEGKTFASVKAGAVFKFSPKEDMALRVSFSAIRTVQGQPTTLTCSTSAPLVLSVATAVQCAGGNNNTGSVETVESLCMARGGSIITGEACQCGGQSYPLAWTVDALRGELDKVCPVTDKGGQMMALCTQRGGKVETMGDLGCTCASGNFVSFGAAAFFENFKSIMTSQCPQ